MRASTRLDPDLPRLRPGTPDDLDSLVAIETAAFAADTISRRSMRRFLTAGSAAVIVAERSEREPGPMRLANRCIGPG